MSSSVPNRNANEAVGAALRGPRGWRNWRTQRDGRPARGALEYACYTDAPLVGSIEHDFGPYRLLNTLATLADQQAGRAQLALVLRVDLHLDETDEPELPPPLQVPDEISESGNRRALDELFAGWTDSSTYHAGQLDDELAALVSLALGSGSRAAVGSVSSALIIRILAAALSGSITGRRTWRHHRIRAGQSYRRLRLARSLPRSQRPLAATRSAGRPGRRVAARCARLPGRSVDR
jgi:hypothetical protein